MKVHAKTRKKTVCVAVGSRTEDLFKRDRANTTELMFISDPKWPQIWPICIYKWGLTELELHLGLFKTINSRWPPQPNIRSHAKTDFANRFLADFTNLYLIYGFSRHLPEHKKALIKSKMADGRVGALVALQIYVFNKSYVQVLTQKIVNWRKLSTKIQWGGGIFFVESRRTNDVFDGKEALLQTAVCHGRDEVSPGQPSTQPRWQRPRSKQCRWKTGARADNFLACCRLLLAGDETMNPVLQTSLRSFSKSVRKKAKRNLLWHLWWIVSCALYQHEHDSQVANPQIDFFFAQLLTLWIPESCFIK